MNGEVQAPRCMYPVYLRPWPSWLVPPDGGVFNSPNVAWLVVPWCAFISVFCASVLRVDFFHKSL